MRLMELWTLLVDYRIIDMSDGDVERYDYALGRFQVLRPEQQDIENYLFRAETGPGRYPVIAPLDWGSDTTATVDDGTAAGTRAQNSSAPGQTATIDEPELSFDISDTAPIHFTSDDDLATITYGMFDRTIPTLEVDNRVREDYFSADSDDVDFTLTATSRENIINISPVDEAVILQGSTREVKKRKYGEVK